MTLLIIKKNDGQVALTLLIFTIIATMVVTAAILMVTANAQSTTKFQQGHLAYYAAENGIENAILRLLRNPNYPGETLIVDPLTKAVVTVAGDQIKTVISQGTAGNISKKIEVIIDYTNNILRVVSWNEKL